MGQQEEKIKNRNKRRKKEEEVIEIFLSKARDLGFTGTLKKKVRIVGRPPLKIIPEERSVEYAKKFLYFVQKEIDILHEKPDGSCDIIEIKDELNWEAIGQVIGYRILLAKERNILKKK